MIDTYSFLGLPFQFRNICKVYPPKIKELLEETSYPFYKKIFLITQEDIEDEYVERQLPVEEMPTPLGFLFELVKSNSKTKQAIMDGFTFFIKEPVLLLSDQQMIIIGDMEKSLKSVKSVQQLRIIKEDNYFEFQNCVRRALGEKEAEPYNPNENPKIKYFKAKARLRDRVKATNSKDGLTLGSTLASICCMNFGINPLNVGELSYAAVAVLMKYYQEKYKYEIDVQSLLAGADKNKVQPQFWIRNIED